MKANTNILPINVLRRQEKALEISKRYYNKKNKNVDGEQKTPNMEVIISPRWINDKYELTLPEVTLEEIDVMLTALLLIRQR